MAAAHARPSNRLQQSSMRQASWRVCFELQAGHAHRNASVSVLSQFYARQQRDSMELPTRGRGRDANTTVFGQASGGGRSRLQMSSVSSSVRWPRWKPRSWLAKKASIVACVRSAGTNARPKMALMANVRLMSRSRFRQISRSSVVR
jgi:hypothetical protein